MLRNVKEAVFAAAYSFLPYLQNFIQQRKLMSDYLSIFITTVSQSLVTNIPKVTEKG